VTGIKAEGVRVELGGHEIIRGVSLTVESGTWHAVIGPNGAGKSTLLRAVAGLLAYRGDILVGGAAIRSLSIKERARLIAFVPQQPQLPADTTVGAYVLFGRTPHLGYLAVESPKDREIAAAALERLELTGFTKRRLGTLSGGERQRVVLARALAQQARVLLLDEPTTALDLGHQQQVLDLVDELRCSEGLTVVSTMHDLSVAAQYADELTLLVEGKAVACGGADEVLTERLLAEHYGARVKVFDDGAGRPVVHLIRGLSPSDP
jgi:iron complex transport system ATP-binding protein